RRGRATRTLDFRSRSRADRHRAPEVPRRTRSRRPPPRLLALTHRHALAGQERALEVDCVRAAAVTTDPAARPETAVARDHERKRVRRHRAADGTRRARAARHLREFAVRNRLAPRNITAQGLEDSSAEPVDAVEVELEVEVVPPPREPVVELRAD